MGKFQLDYKGQARVQRFHEKHSTGQSDKVEKTKDLKAKFVEKFKKQGKK